MSTTIVGRNPLPVGDRWMVICNHIGPASYTQVTPGASPTGGDVITAQECGLKFIQAIHASGDDSGSYLPVPLAIIGDAASGILGWWITSGMTQVAGAVNLSARSTRLVVWGR
jgi:hypothetical protein